MKKLMIAAATTAIAGGVFGADVHPQVYDMTLTLKMTTCQKGKYKTVCGEEGIVYRKQSTQKFYGKFWGCGCETIACAEVGSYGRYARKADLARGGDHFDQNGFVFWAKNDAFRAANMEWDLLQLVGNKGTNIEGFFNLDLFTTESIDAGADPDNDDGDLMLYGAGYGTASVTDCDILNNPDCSNYIKSMSGNVVGICNDTALTEAAGCLYCGTADCNTWDFCLDNCNGLKDDTKTAVFGSFTLKYNASQSKALLNGNAIADVGKFNKSVLAMFDTIAEADKPVPGPSAEEIKAEEAKDKAEKAYVDATKALAEKEAAYVDATNALALAEAAYDEVAKNNKATELHKAAADAATELSDAANALNAFVTSNACGKAVKAAEDNVKTAEEAFMSATNKIAAQKNLDDAKKVLETERDLADPTDLKAYDDAKAKVAECTEAKDAADEAETTWNATGYNEALSDADKKVEDAKAGVAKAKEDVEKAESAKRDAWFVCQMKDADCE